MSTDETVVWEEPPPREGRRSTIFTKNLVEEMRAHPLRWAVIKKAHGNSSTPYNWQKAHLDFEVMVRVSETKKGFYDIWARYVGGKMFDE